MRVSRRGPEEYPGSRQGGDSASGLSGIFQMRVSWRGPEECPGSRWGGGSSWGFEARKVKLMVDSSAAKAMSERKGVGANRHVQARYLWLQDKVFNKELEVGKVAGKVNDADLVTKVQPRATIHAHLQRLGFEKSGREGRQGLT